MDQCVAALGLARSACLEFSRGSVSVRRIEPLPCEYFLLLCDLKGSKDTVKILSSLQAAAAAAVASRGM